MEKNNAMSVLEIPFYKFSVTMIQEAPKMPFSILPWYSPQRSPAQLSADCAVVATATCSAGCRGLGGVCLGLAHGNGMPCSPDIQLQHLVVQRLGSYRNPGKFEKYSDLGTGRGSGRPFLFQVAEKLCPNAP